MWNKKCPDCGSGLRLGASTFTFCCYECDLCGYWRFSREGCADEIRHGTVPEWAIFDSVERFGEHPYDASRHYLIVHVASKEVALVTDSAALAVHVRNGLLRGEKIGELKNATPAPLEEKDVTLGWSVGGDIGVVLKTAGDFKSWMNEAAEGSGEASPT